MNLVNFMGELVPEAEVAKRLGLKVQTLRAWRARRKGPAYIVAGRVCWYRESALSRWLASQEVDPAELKRSA